MMGTSLLKHPSAFVPVAMSGAALALVVGYVAMFGIVHQADEGTPAHIFQFLMVGQMPVVALFALKFLPREPRRAVGVLALQGIAALLAIAPVVLLQL
jgi:peptidoglycan/LPS O-acetylase OafA/YrhL